MDSKCDIFISYRRSDGRDIARIIQQALLAKGYDNIFFDYSSLRDGVFNEQIIDAIECCKDYIVVLSPDSLSRCAIAGDWVAREMEAAISAGCHIIPVAIDVNYDMFPENLPDQLKVIENLQQTKLLTNEYFDDSINRLTQRLLSKPGKQKVEDEASKKVADEANQETVEANARQKDENAKLKPVKGRKKRFGIEYGEELYGYADEAGKLVIPYQWKWAGDFSEGLAWVKDYNNKFGFINTEGSVVIPCQWVWVMSFREGLACVADSNNGKWGFVDKKGKVVIPCKWKEVGLVSEGTISVRDDNDKWGYIDITGKIIIPCQWEKAGSFRDGLATVWDKNYKKYKIDVIGKII